jgi:hypothetical protein
MILLCTSGIVTVENNEKAPVILDTAVSEPASMATNDDAHLLSDTQIALTSPAIDTEGCSPAMAVPESIFMDVLSAPEQGLSVPDIVQEQYNQDPFYTDILENSKHYKNFSVWQGLVMLKEHGNECLCTPDVKIDGRSMQEVIITHVHSLLAHLGATKTMTLL